MHPPRLSRLDQVFPKLSIYFITCNTHQRRPLLANKVVHEAFRTFCQRAKERHVWVGRYVMMPDHLHLFVDCGNDVLLGDWVKSLKNSLSKTLRQQAHESPRWQKGFFDHLVRSESSYEQKWHYSRDNPVRAKLVSKADEWPYQGEIAPLPFN
jgi:putative transposase